jgi:hypothetical protein
MCKECIYENILTQRKEIGRLQQLYEQQQQNRAAEEQIRQLEAEEAKKLAFVTQQDSIITSAVGSKLKEKLRAGNALDEQQSAGSGSRKSSSSSFWVVRYWCVLFTKKQ